MDLTPLAFMSPHKAESLGKSNISIAHEYTLPHQLPLSAMTLASPLYIPHRDSESAWDWRRETYLSPSGTNQNGNPASSCTFMVALCSLIIAFVALVDVYVGLGIMCTLLYLDFGAGEYWSTFFGWGGT